MNVPESQVQKNRVSDTERRRDERERKRKKEIDRERDRERERERTRILERASRTLYTNQTVYCDLHSDAISPSNIPKGERGGPHLRNRVGDILVRADGSWVNRSDWVPTEVDGQGCIRPRTRLERNTLQYVSACVRSSAYSQSQPHSPSLNNIAKQQGVWSSSCQVLLQHDATIQTSARKRATYGGTMVMLFPDRSSKRTAGDSVNELTMFRRVPCVRLLLPSFRLIVPPARKSLKIGPSSIMMLS